MTFKLFNIRLEKLVKSMAGRDNMRQVGKRAKEIVVGRTSRGFGVSKPEGKRERLKGLSSTYKKQRRRLKKKGQLSSETTPKKSNLTKTRQMLESVNYNGQVGKAEVFLDNNKAETKAQGQKRQGREFMNLSKSEVKEIVKLLENELLKDIRKKGL